MPKAQHSKAASFVRQNLFGGVTTFAEFETRVAALPDEQARGDAFEVFAEAYLATQRKHDAANVWPLTAVPIQILQTLGLTTKDYGVDGVFNTLLGNFNVYQVKFRTGRPALTWRELSTFMGLADSPQIRSRVLFTNCDELPSVLNERQGFFCIRGSDLDRLESDDFRAIEAWLADVVFIAPKKQPQPHQAEALGALLPALEAHDRVSAIMACGTGKTLVALWVAEARLASRILVLLPSLALLRQVLHEWLRESNLPGLAYLCVCSDPTVKDGLDSITTTQSDLDFQVSTDAASVREFLDAPFAGRKVVFSTYQSARVVGAAVKPGEVFDLAVFDEAHKTAGREGRNYAFALEDVNLPICKRLFLTATPRHYNPHQQDRDGDAKLLFSMDRPDVYGPQAYCLTFAEAARRGIICGYKVIISVITSEMVTNELLKRGDVMVNGDAVCAREVANQIALRDVIEKYGAQKVFTFHKTVASAESFVADGSEGIRSHLPNFETFHVNGTMPTARREREMRDFRAAACAVMSNARCLTEGVDVPAVDMVAFLSPRRSRVDIVQATGRAMRRSPDKTTGYVLVPLFVEQAANESVEAAVSRSNFEEVWDVLHSLQEQDDVLADLIRNMGERKGRGKGFDDSGFADRVDIVGFQIGFEELRSAVATRCFESLFSSWDTYFGKLAAFKDRMGHCNVSSIGEDAQLGSWVAAQRNRRKNIALTEGQIARLDGLGFVWDWQEQRAQENWMKWYRELENYAKEKGNPHVPRTHMNVKLASWVWIQRLRKERDYNSQSQLTPDQVALLEKIGFHWDINEEKWIDMIGRLRRFREEHGHCDLSEDEDLSTWAQRQRSAQARNKLDPERKAQLDELGFSWTGNRDRRWDEMFDRLKQYHTKNGNSDVPAKWNKDPKLARWLSAQRQRRKKDEMTEDEMHRLDSLGVTWKSRDVGKWEDRYHDLLKFKEINGHCNVPFAYKKTAKLGAFVNSMRTKKATGELSEERTRLLEAIGFQWTVRDAIHDDLWDARFQQLVTFKAAHGHCDVPTKSSDDPPFGYWVSRQRGDKRKGIIEPDRARRLDDIGFNWRLDDGQKEWADVYEQLKEFKNRFGHCKVPLNFSDNPSLGVWARNQRHRLKYGKLSAEKEQLLLEIGFE